MKRRNDETNGPAATPRSENDESATLGNITGASFSRECSQKVLKTAFSDKAKRLKSLEISRL
ncbi:MAG: hypothetical protein KH404_05875 [Bifidobacterium pseudolongum]|nr:hypothetical protein [Bifidobacterium pseudolongum]